MTYRLQRFAAVPISVLVALPTTAASQTTPLLSDARIEMQAKVLSLQ